MKKTIGIILALALAFTLVACGPAGGEGDGKFVIGAYLPITGTNAGPEMERVLNLVAEEVNLAGGINGELVVIKVIDTEGKAENSVKAVSQFISDGVDAVIGSYNSGEVLAAASYLNEAKIVNFGCGTSSSFMKEDWPYVFRANANKDWASSDYAKLFTDTFKFTKIAIFHGQDDNSVSNSNALVAALKNSSVSVVANEAGTVTDTDYSGQVQNIIRSGAQAVYFAISGGGPLFVKQLRNAGYDGLIFDSDVFMTSHVEVAGEEVSQNIVSVTPYVTYASIENCDVPIMKDFLERYYAKYSKLPITENCCRCYDAIGVLLEAAKRAKSNDGDAIVAQINKINDFEGLGGVFDYTVGDREGLHSSKTFIRVDGQYKLLDSWLSSGGYDAYKTETGNDY